MGNRELTERAQQVLFQNYRTQPIALVRGQGTSVWDADGKKYLEAEVIEVKYPDDIDDSEFQKP